ncbi:CYFA0S01e15500g1_1 [Cyberlindnera fabianii]|uniref:CYFA0S01e15500g1_1 n=1 Tax=Cyberlindnera fabianii TaxID=36022 RepID=A0A061AKP5_CYBFA|nr:Cell growth-regulating nucleolar protein [Cyberlindnera fabianii]CDR37711.1 CYFA0S01e15500g1_1 [Cyberlindnera fabianii]
MVTFSCEVCNESLAKKKLDQHTQRCYGAYFTCIDCSTTFNGNDYRQHTQCITEDEKYQKALFRPKKKNTQQQQQQQPKPKEQPKKVETPKEEPKKSKKEDKSKVTKPSLKEHKGKDLYKALKKFSKDEKKELLKRISIKDDGSLVLN